jgi:hypothetical protein
MEDFKINASSCGKIMGKKGLGKTGETFINEKLVEGIFDRKKEFDNKFTIKGDLAENGSIQYISDILGYSDIIKNEEKFDNEWMKGTPDVIMEDKIIDVKNSWDCFTFPFFNTEVPKMDYYWQAQVYMELVGLPEYELIYILMDTPIHLIERDSYYWCKDNGYEDKEGDVLRSFEQRMCYDDIPDKNRVRVFKISRNEKDIELIKERVTLCRQYIGKLETPEPSIIIK